MKKTSISVFGLSLALGLVGLLALPFFARETSKSPSTAMIKPVEGPDAVRALGGPRWGRTYSRFLGLSGRFQAEHDWPSAMAPTSGGRFVVAGSVGGESPVSSSYSGLSVAEISPHGQVNWEVLYPSNLTSSCTANAFDVAYGPDGCLVVGSYFDPSYDPENRHALVMKIDPEGRVAWVRSHSLGLEHNDSASAVARTSDGGWAIAGTTISQSTPGFYPGSLWILKIDGAGQVSWSEVLEFPGWSVNPTYCRILETADKGLAVAGTISKLIDDPDIECDRAFVIKLNSAGRLNWGKSFGIPSACTEMDSTDIEAHSITATSDGGFALAGSAIGATLASPWGIWVAEITASGSIIWQRVYRGIESGYGILQASDGGYLVAAGFGPEFTAFALKVNSKGVPEWAKAYGSDAVHCQEMADAIEKPGGGYVMITWSFAVLSDEHWAVLSTDASGYLPGSACTLVHRIGVRSQKGSAQAFPLATNLRAQSPEIRDLPHETPGWPPVLIKDICFH